VAITALVVSTPWRGGPTVLERAAAAISAPAGDQVLYEDIDIKWVGPHKTKGQTKLELWLGPSRFRVLNLHDGRTIDVGGTIGGTAGLSYDRAYNVFAPVSFPFAVARTSLNPASFVRSALASGRARDAGKTTIAGRQVIRIALGKVGLAPSANYFVDARTYEPVRITVRAVAPNASPLSVPLADALELPYGYFPRMAKPEPHAGYLFVYDFKAFRYLPSTPANQKLADIHSAHPGAKVA